MKVDIGGVVWKNPVSTASGVFGFGEEYSSFFDINALGAICLKSLTLKKQVGNDSPRIAETSSGILNSIGLQNPGIDFFIKHELPKLKKICKTNIIASIAGSSIEEYAIIAEMLGSNVNMIELNISCPNVKEECITFGINSKSVENITKKIKKVSKVPLIVKLSPNVENICDISKAAESGGADALSLVNTFLGMKIDIKNQKPYFKNTFAGLSGPAIKPIALRMVWQARLATKLPIIGLGGITCTNDALEFLMAGANAVAIGTYGFFDPLIWPKIKDGIEKYLIENNINDIKNISLTNSY
jgi:dihydroorotate dehydrogenase (NAD+) catalytic subunit